MGPAELLKYLANTLDVLSISYLVTGSTATIAYGEPRLTNDIDVVADRKLPQVPALCAAFPVPDYYCSAAAAAEQAVRPRFQFNILHPASGLKIDLIMATNSALDRSRLPRGIRLPTGDDCEATLAAPEDVISKKLQYYSEGDSA